MNELEQKILACGDSIHEVVALAFDEEVKEHSFKTIRDYAPYGDTEVEVCRYSTDEEEEEFREELEKEMTVDSIIEKLKNDKDFREAVGEMIEHVVWNRDI